MNKTFELLNESTEILINSKKIKEDEIGFLPGNELPAIKSILKKTPIANNVYAAMYCFADFTKQLASTSNLTEVKHCFMFAGKLLKEGNNIVKNAIGKVYLFSLSTRLDVSEPTNAVLKNMLPAPLHKENDLQVNASGL
ncbi:MAG: hypothetical protein H7296_16160 [Bacteroidia bacterium]|nr:hypothetical protein [Bacteroidia bacterium]